MQLSRNDAFLSTRVGDETVILNSETGDFVGLTATAASAWDMLDKPQDIDALCAALTEQFEVTAEQCRDEIGRFVDDMIGRGAILVDPANGPDQQA